MLFEEEKKMEKEKEREETQPASFLSTRFVSSLKESILIYILRVRGSHASLSLSCLHHLNDTKRGHFDTGSGPDLGPA